MNRRDRLSVKPCLDRITNRFDPDMIPIPLLKQLSPRFGKRLRITTQRTRIEPISSCFIVYPGCPPSVSCWVGIDFHLIAVNPLGRNIDGLALPNNLRLLVKALATDLNARIQTRIILEIELQDEISISPLGT